MRPFKKKTFFVVVVFFLIKMTFRVRHNFIQNTKDLYTKKYFP